MYKEKRILAIVTARGGSKGLPGKNIRMMNGKPLIAWTIEAAKSSKYLDKLFISTDSREIANVCEAYGVSVPALRPQELAQDTTPSTHVLCYTLDFLGEKGEFFDYMILLEPTSPLRNDRDIDRMIEIAVDNPNADGCISLGRVNTVHPSIIKKINSEGYIIPYIENGKVFYQRQMEDEAYFPYGVGYLVKITAFREKLSIYTDKMLPYFIERWQNYEVDDIYDFECISAIMKMEIE